MLSYFNQSSINEATGTDWQPEGERVTNGVLHITLIKINVIMSY